MENINLAPSVVRRIILEEHEQLRALLKETRSLMNAKNYPPLQNILHELMHFFLKHIEHEEKILRPVLKEIDAWGTVRVNKMNEEHATQRAEILRLNTLLSTAKPEIYLQPMEAFIKELYKDMEGEERECLSADLLKDDPITSGTSG